MIARLGMMVRESLEIIEECGPQSFLRETKLVTMKGNGIAIDSTPSKLLFQPSIITGRAVLSILGLPHGRDLRLVLMRQTGIHAKLYSSISKVRFFRIIQVLPHPLPIKMDRSDLFGKLRSVCKKAWDTPVYVQDALVEIGGRTEECYIFRRVLSCRQG